MRHRYAPSQADVTVYSALSSAPDADKYPNAARWHKNIASYQGEFESLPGDKSSDISKYGPTAAAAAADADDDDLDLFGSDDEEEDAEKEALAAKRLAEYRAKKALKPKTSTPPPPPPGRWPRGCRETNPCGQLPNPWLRWMSSPGMTKPTWTS